MYNEERRIVSNVSKRRKFRKDSREARVHSSFSTKSQDSYNKLSRRLSRRLSVRRFSHKLSSRLARINLYNNYIVGKANLIDNIAVPHKGLRYLFM